MDYVEFMETKRTRLLRITQAFESAWKTRNLTTEELRVYWDSKSEISRLTVAIAALRQIVKNRQMEADDRQEGSDE